MLADLDETIRQLLILEADIDPNEIEISFEAPDREWSGRLSRPAVNCFLYDLRENQRLRPHGMEVQRSNNGNATKTKGPIRIDVTYQVTVWARAREDEHRLLWRVLAALSRHATVPETIAIGKDGRSLREPVRADDPRLDRRVEVLQGLVKQQPFPIPTWVSQPEQMPQNYADLWQALENRIRPALTYVLTVALDPEFVLSSPMVLTAPKTRAENQDRRQVADELEVRGRVRDRQDPTRTLAGAVVVLRETGARATTDDEGRFAFKLAPRGPINLIVRARGRGEVVHPARVPSPAVLDLEI